MKKTAAIILTLALMLAAVPTVMAATTDSLELTAIGGSTTVPEIAQGSAFTKGTLTVKNTTTADLSDPTDATEKIKVISYKIGNGQDYFDTTKHPFEITNINENVSLNNLEVPKDGTFTIDLTGLKIRGDATADYWNIPIVVSYTKPDSTTPDAIKEFALNLNIKVTQKSVEPPANALVPKVLISGFTTNPSTVVAGNTFTLNVTFTNKGGSPVTSLKASMTSDGTFSPTSGSSTLFIDNLNPGESKSASIKLETKADATPGSYTVSFALNYDAPGANDNEPVIDTEVLSIPVIQVPKVSVDKLTVAPETVYANGEINITTKLNNTGKSILYNVTAQFTDKNGVFADGSVFVGNVSPGAVGAIDVYLAAISLGEADIKMTITYENENGKKYTYEDSYSTVVTEKEIMPVDPVLPDEPTKGGLSWWVYLILLLLIGGIVTLALLKKRKAKKARETEKSEAMQLEEELLKEESDTAPTDNSDEQIL